MPHAYVDGSYNVSTKRFGYGIVLFTDAYNSDGTQQEIRMSKAFSHEELAEMRNVAGEIMGAAQAMKTAKEESFREMDLDPAADPVQFVVVQRFKLSVSHS